MEKLQDFFKWEGITHATTKTHANVAERAIRTFKKMIADRLRANKDKTWVDMLKPSLTKYNTTQTHSATGIIPNKAHNLDNTVQAETNLILKEKHNRKYPNLTEGDYVRVYEKGKGNYTSRKESRNQWSDKKDTR